MVIIILSGWMFLSCDRSQDRERLLIYFDLISLIEEQLVLVTKENPRVSKKVTLNGESEETKTAYDSLGWSEELKIFLESDINKPSFVGSFQEQQGQDRVTYLRKDSDSDGVKGFIVDFYPGTKVPMMIEIKSSRQNSLYRSGTRLELRLNNIDGAPRLSSYAVEGNQSILSGGVTNYKLEAVLEYSP